MSTLSTIPETTELTTGSIATSFTDATRTSSTLTLHDATDMQLAVQAAQKGDVETLGDMLNGRVSADELDVEGCGLMHWAAINNKLQVIELLLSHHANIDIIGGLMQATPLHWACSTSSFEAVVTLVTNGANPSIKNTNGETPLLVAAQTGHLMLIAYLLVKFEHTRDGRDHMGRSALMLASKTSYGLIPARIFVKCDVYLDFVDDETGDTALHIQMRRQNYKGVVELICSGASDEIKNKEGQTAWDLVKGEEEKGVREEIKTRQIRENGTWWDKISSRHFLIQAFTATISAVVIGLGFALFYLVNFWILLALMLLFVGLLVVFMRKKRADQLGVLPVTYIFWMGMSELALLIFATDGFIHWSILMILATIWVISASFYWLLILTDPGVMEPSSNAFADFLQDIEQRKVDGYCFTCWIPKTRTSHHCAQCDKCVDDFDHHCPWINKCVYRQNLRFFVLFCITNLLFDVLYVPTLLYIVLASWGERGFNNTVQEHGLIVISLGISIFHVIGAAAITYTQVSHISRQVTTIQMIRKCREAKQRALNGSTEQSPPSDVCDQNKPSMKVRVSNVWNLLAFDKFGNDPDSETSASETSTRTATNTSLNA